MEMEQLRSRTPIWPFVAAGLVLLACIGGAIYLFITGLLGLSSGLIRIEAPGIHQVQLDKAGGYTIFLETGEVRDGVLVGGETSAGGLSVRVETPDGATIPVGASTVAGSYSFGGRQGRSIMQFDVPQPGNYKVTTEFVQSQPRSPVILTISGGFAKNIVISILAPIGLFLGGVIAAVLIVVITLVSRKSSPREPYSSGSVR
jgi:hypothetical protein